MIGDTVRVKLRLRMLLLAPLSFTVTVRVAEPFASGAGRKLKMPAVSGLL